MEIDLDAIERQLGIGGKRTHNVADLEDDDETLLAELMELQDETTSQSIKLPPIGNKIAENATNDVNAEGSDVEIGDNDLLSELNDLMEVSEDIHPVKGANKMNSAGPASVPKIPSHKADDKPEIRKIVVDHGKVTSSDTIPVDPKPTAPPIPPRNASIEVPKPKVEIEPPKPTIKQNEPAPKPEVIADASSSSLNDRAKSLLMRRRKLYLERAKAAKEANDRATAVDAYDTVKLFIQALKLIDEGAELTEEDLTQIPPTPPPYGLPENSQAKPTATSNMDKKIPKGAEADRKAQNDANKAGSSTVSKMAEPYISEELRLALMRQAQLKKEAMEAKKRGNKEEAIQFLTLAHRMDQMVEAAKCGLPIDIQQIPNVESNSKAMTPNSLKRSPIGGETLRKCQILERELLKQIEFCREKATQFQTVSDTKNILFYEELQRKCKADLHVVKMSMLGNSTLPPFKFGEMLFPNIELNPSIGEDQLQLKICRIENLQLPKGWKPSDCSFFVFFKFPFPHGSQQTGRTAIVRGTISPEFSDIFQLKIKRKTKQFVRICKRIPLKLEIFHKGGFLRSDKPFGHADIGMEELQMSALIQGRFDILDGRKKTGGFVHVEIRINKPLGTEENSAGTGAMGIKRKWIELQR